MDFNNTGAMRSPFSPRIRQSIGGRRPMGLSSSENNQSKFMQSAGEPAGDVIYKTPLITVETYGLPLPVMVTEALTFGSGDVTVRMSPCGWCWVVSGRRVLVWPSVRPPGAGAAPPGALAARELTLPQTDLAHKADLVYVFYSDGAQMPGCVGVSPEGVVRCWGSVGAEGVFQDASCELAGQECARLVPAAGALLLATTTCTLVLLAPCTVDGRATVRCRTLRAPSGWLGGLGRRVSHMFFGNLPHGDTRLVGVVGVGGSSTAPHVALVAGGSGGPLLQLWCGEDLHEHSLRRAILDSQQLTAHGEGPGGAEVTALDVRGTAGGDLLLLLAVAAAPHVRYHIAHVSLAEPTRPVVRTLGALRWPAEGAPPRLLPLDAHALLYTATCVALASPGGEGECVRLGAEGDRVLAAEACGDRALLFTRTHGVTLLTVTPGAQGAPGAAPGQPRAAPADAYDGHLTLFEVDPHEARSLATDACGKLKVAFLFHLRREPAACAALLQELGAGSEPDGPLDRAVAGAARSLVDDAPAGDPRWPDAGAGLALGASAALHPRGQLRDKARALHLLAEFLRAAGLWARLPAAAAVRALAELLAGARAACALHAGPHARVLDAAAAAACAPAPAEEAALARGALAPADLCYRRVSQLPRLLRALAAAPAPAPAPAPAAARHALACCEVLTSILSEMHAARAAWGGAAPAPDLGPRALLPALAALHRRVLENALTCSGGLRAQLQEAAAALASAVLWDAAALPPASYAALRRELILPYVEDGQTERAVALAEKFQDLELLVQLCVEAGDLPRLQGYFSKYEGMAELAYRWAWGAGGGRRALLVRALGGRGLRAWLQAAPARAPLLALHCLHAARARAAAAALLQLAAAERADRHRMATMASLSKLCAIAGAGEEGAGAEGEEEEEEEGAERLRAQAEERLALAAAHAALAHAGGEVGKVVHSTEDLVKMFAEAGRGALSEHAYLRAVLLAASTHDRQLLLQVWCGAVLCDEWARPDGPNSVQDEWARPDGPASVQDELEGKTFYRLLLLLHATESELEVVLPPLSELAGAPALAHVTSHPRARHLLRHAYAAVAPPTGADDTLLRPEAWLPEEGRAC